jgi:hypothetical protein
MAERTITREDVLEHRATPGSEGGRVMQAPLAPRRVGPRDALIADGHQEADFVPDVDRLHLGFVPQPTVPLRDADGNVIGYLAQEELREILQVPAPPVTLRDLKRAHNAVESTKEWQRHIRPVGPGPLGEEDSYAFNDEDNDRVKAARSRQEAAEKEGTDLGKAPAQGSRGQQGGTKEPTEYQQRQARAKELYLPAGGSSDDLQAAITAEEKRLADGGAPRDADGNIPTT